MNLVMSVRSLSNISAVSNVTVRGVSEVIRPRELKHRLRGTATTTSQIKNLIGRVRKNERAARAARTYEQVRAVLFKTTT